MFKFSIMDAISFGWETCKKNFLFFVLVGLVFLGVMILLGIIQGLMPRVIFIAPIMSILSLIVYLIMGMGLIIINLKVVDGEKPELADLFTNYQQVLQFLIATILAGIATFIGMLLLIIPGFYIATKLSLVPYLVVDKKMNGIDALKESWKLTDGNFWNLTFFNWCLVLLLYIGLFLFVVGVIPAMIVASLSFAYAYRKIAGPKTIISN